MLIHIHPCYLQNLYFALKESKEKARQFFDHKEFEGFLKVLYPIDFIANVDTHKFLKKSTFQENPS